MLSRSSRLQWSDTTGTVTIYPTANAVPTVATNAALSVGVAVECSAAGDGSGRLVLEQLDIDIV